MASIPSPIVQHHHNHCHSSLFCLALYHCPPPFHRRPPFQRHRVPFLKQVREEVYAAEALYYFTEAVLAEVVGPIALAMATEAEALARVEIPRRMRSLTGDPDRKVRHY